MKIDLDGKIAVVTGAAGGIGKAIAKSYLENSAIVVIADITDRTGEQAAQHLSSLGPCRYIHADVTSREQVDQLIQEVVAAFGKIDIFVNNAGINVASDSDRVDIDAFSQENWDKLLEVNLTGVFYCSQAVSRVMIRQKGGKIINIGSVLGNVPARKQIGFIAAKGGVHHMTKAMALELAPHGIVVNGIAPGSIAIDKNLFDSQDAVMAALRERMLSHVPLARFGREEDIANAALFLSAEESNYITGHILVVDGGWTAGYTRDF